MSHFKIYNSINLQTLTSFTFNNPRSYMSWTQSLTKQRVILFVTEFMTESVIKFVTDFFGH